MKRIVQIQKLLLLLILMLNASLLLHAERWEDDTDYSEIDGFVFQRDFHAEWYYGTAIFAAIAYAIGRKLRSKENPLVNVAGTLLLIAMGIAVLLNMGMPILYTIFILTQVGIGILIIAFAVWLYHEENKKKNDPK